MTIAQLGIEHLSLFGSTARGGAREESDIDLFFDYKRQKGKVGLFDLVDVKEPSRSSSTMTRAFCQLSAAARLALPPVPPYERYRGIVHMTAAPDSPHRRAALMEAAGAAGLHKLTSRVFWLGSEQATYGDRFQTSRGRNIVAAAPARQASPQVLKLTIHAASCDIPPN